MGVLWYSGSRKHEYPHLWVCVVKLKLWHWLFNVYFVTLLLTHRGMDIPSLYEESSLQLLFRIMNLSRFRSSPRNKPLGFYECTKITQKRKEMNIFFKIVC